MLFLTVHDYDENSYRVCSNCYDYELNRLCDETFGITKYCLDLEIEILDIYPFIALVRAL